MPTKRQITRAKRLYRVLEKKYGHKRKAKRRPLLDQLLLSVLSDNSTDAFDGDGLAAFNSLCKEYVDWNEVRVASYSEIADVLTKCNVPAQKAEQVRSLLQQVYDKKQVVHLDFIEPDFPMEAFRLLREMFENLDSATLYMVLLLSLEVPLLPVTPEVIRITERIGLTGKGVLETSLQKVYEEAVRTEDLYRCYRLLMEHAKKSCLEEEPKCARCTAASFCDSADSFIAAVED